MEEYQSRPEVKARMLAYVRNYEKLPYVKAKKKYYSHMPISIWRNSLSQTVNPYAKKRRIENFMIFLEKEKTKVTENDQMPSLQNRNM
jgi:molybdopterin-guanine dinucleotide biosynthesis protein A